MSGIPTIGTWATAEINYPAGGNPWNGQPVLVAPIGDIFTPNTKPPAQSFNFLFNKSDKQAQIAYNLAVSSAVSNWTRKTLLSDLTGLSGTALNWCGFGWDITYERWVGGVAINNGGNLEIQIYYTVDNGKNWVSQTTSGNLHGSPLTFLVGKPPDNAIVTIAAPASAGNVTASSIVGGSETQTVLGALTGANAATIFTLGSNIWTYFAQQTGGTFAANFYRGTNDGLTWTTETAALPGTNWQSGTNHVGPLLSAVGTVASTASAVIAICGATAGTDQARLLKVTQSAGTPTTTDITPGTQLPAGTIITGLTFGANDGLWGMATFDGGNYHIYSSSDLVTWTAVSILDIGGGNTSPTNLAVVGSVWITSTARSYGNSRIMISADVASNPAGTVWHPVGSDIGVTPPANGLGGLFSNGNQVVAGAAGAVTVSNAVGFV